VSKQGSGDLMNC